MDLEALYRSHAEPLLRYLIRQGTDCEVAADAVQESFLRLAQATVPPDAPRAWLYRVATNIVWEHSRTSRRRDKLLEHGRFRIHDPSTPDPAEDFDRAEAKRLVGTALAQLSNRDRTALLLRYEGFSLREIADITGLAPASVGTTLCRALNRLAQRIPEEAAS